MKQVDMTASTQLSNEYKIDLTNADTYVDPYFDIIAKLPEDYYYHTMRKGKVMKIAEHEGIRIGDVYKVDGREYTIQFFAEVIGYSEMRVVNGENTHSTAEFYKSGRLIRRGI